MFQIGIRSSALSTLPSPFSSSDDWFKICFTSQWLAFSQPLRHLIGFRLILLATQSMPQLVRNGEIPKSVNAHMPPSGEFDFTPGYIRDEGFFDECLALPIVGERRAVRIEAPGEHNGFPILGAHEDPSPFSKLRYGILRDSPSQSRTVFEALLQRVAGVADKALEKSFIFWRSGSGYLRQFRQKNK